MYSVNDTWLIPGGFPHSEISGSKGALASPELIAECHVLHRLLSPRHPPNALFALDPIQPKNGLSRTSFQGGVQPPVTDRNVRIFPMDASAIPEGTTRTRPVSFLRLGKTAYFPMPEGIANMRYFLSLHDVNDQARRPDHAYGPVKPAQKGKTARRRANKNRSREGT